MKQHRDTDPGVMTLWQRLHHLGDASVFWLLQWSIVAGGG